MGNYSIENFIFNDWENQIKPRSNRSKHRKIIEACEKKLIKFYKEHKELSKTKHELPMVDLHPPIQKGYKRYFVLRPDLRNNKEAAFFEALLEKINTYQYSATKDFKSKKRKLGRKVYVAKEQKLKSVYPYEIKKMGLTEKEMTFFELKTEVKRVGRRLEAVQYYEFDEAWRFELRIRPNIITKVKLFDHELEKKLAELNQILFQNQVNRGKLGNLKGWHNYTYWEKGTDKIKYKNSLKNRTLSEIIENNK